MSVNTILSDNRDVVLLGAGGHAKVLLDTLSIAGIRVKGIIDPVLAGTKELWRGITVIGNDDDLLEMNPDSVVLVNGIGSLPSNMIRKRLYSNLKAAGFQFMSVVHPSVLMGTGVTLGEGVQIMAGVVVQADTVIGSNSIINTGALLDHDCKIDGNVHIAPGVVISGGVMIGEGAHIGTGSAIIQNVSIGADAIVGAGTVVVKDVPAHHKILGQAPRPLIKLDLE